MKTTFFLIAEKVCHAARHVHQSEGAHGGAASSD
jgi:hypothetical protein